MEKPNRADWRGDVLLLPGIGVFRGAAGDNRPHLHWADQLVVTPAAAGPLSIRSGATTLRWHGVHIAAGVTHQLAPAPVVSVYLDPTTQLARLVRATLALVDTAPGITELPARLAASLRAGFCDGALDAAAVDAFRRDLDARAPLPDDRRMALVLDALHDDLHDQASSGRDALAALAGLSASRFSHWFRASTGMPLRSYRKWLRLILGLEHAMGAASLSSAAHQAGFADQAHFTRTFVDMFGVRPAQALAQLRPTPPQRPARRPVQA
jgi:AraC-like DNA-binding protein